jgi:Dynamin family
MSVDSLAQNLNEQTERYVRMIGPALDRLTSIAAYYEQKDVDQKVSRVAELRKIRTSLETETFRLIVLGRFKNGKSTILNALLGQLTHPVPELPLGGAPLPTADLPCTPILTSIHYNDTPTVSVQSKDEQWKPMSFSRYLTDARVRPDGEENSKAFANVLQFNLGFPTELCKAGVILLDSPGTDDDPDRDAIVNEAITTCDAAIVVYRSDSFGGMGELKDVQEMEDHGLTRYFSIVNLYNKRVVDEQLKGFVWSKLVTKLKGGPLYAQQSFASQDIFFVDAYTALEGKLENNAQKINGSGLAFFERYVQEFLEKERRFVHIQRFVQGANEHALALVSLIEKVRIPALEKERADFERRYAEIKPDLDRIHARKNRLKSIFARYRIEAQRQLVDSFEQLFAQIRQELPEEMKKQQIPSLHTKSFWQNTLANMLSPFQKQKLTKETAEIAQAIVRHKLEAWQKANAQSPGASQVILSVITKMQEEVSQEVTSIGQEYEQVHVQLSGWDPSQANVDVKGPSWGERIVAGGIGLALGQPDYIFTGGVQGFGGVGRDLVGRLAIGIPLMLLHAPFLPVVVPAMMIGGIITNVVWGSSLLENEIKNKVIRGMVQGDLKSGYEGLRGEVQTAKPALEKIVAELFSKIEGEVTRKVDQRISEETQAIESSLRDSSRSAEEKQKLISVMKTHLEGIAASQKVLKEALNAAKQG